MHRTLATAVLGLALGASAQSPAPSPAAPQPAAPGATGASGASGSSGQQSPPAPTPTPNVGPTVRFEDLPVTIRLGARAEIVRRGWPAVPTVVIVPDGVSYIQAISRWTIKGRFPVLIDDGTDAAAEDIARFVRAVQPKSEVRWSAGVPELNTADSRRAAIESAIYHVWATSSPDGQPTELTSQEQLLALWKRTNLSPPGVVVADASDHAWPAALALAIGRAEPIIWTQLTGGIDASMPLEQFVSLAEAVESGAERTGLAWRSLGDVIDAVTVCGNCPVKVQVDPSTLEALTDLLGRLPAADEDAKTAKTPREHGRRWAWSGQIFGTEEQAAYRAMCALFVAPKRAWLFDGYPDTKPWSDYDATAAAKPLQMANLETVVDDTPHNGERAWRLRADAGVDAGLIMVNSRGNGDEFNLEPGRCRPSDVPFLNVPAIVYLVHSWSAAVPGQRTTVAGRWLERGAYAYLGSTQEPYLQAFLPTPAAATRLAAMVPWGAAVRFDDTPPPDHPDQKVAVPPAWKLATIGDPLITIGPAPNASTVPLPLEGAKEFQEILKESLNAKDYAGSIRTLSMLGRDKDAARLAAALLKDDARSFTARVAAESILPLMRAHDTATLVKAYAQLPSDLARDGVRRDALWHACSPEIGSASSEAMIDILRANLRPDQIGRDAADLARPVSRLYGLDSALGMLNAAKRESQTEYDSAQVDAAMKKLSAK